MADLGGRIGQSADTGRMDDARIDMGRTPSSPAAAESTSTLETLDEPVMTTIMRDVRMVGIKLKHVLIPTATSNKELRNWDLWGPLFLCLLLASTLSMTAKEEQTALVFAAVFVIVWCGAAVVTLNAALLGGKISFLQSVCVLGYCLCPLNIASVVCRAWSSKIFHLVVVIICFLWSTRASVGFMGQLVPEDRRALGVFPILLFYITIAWMVLVQ
jgi:hypothetical protein